MRGHSELGTSRTFLDLAGDLNFHPDRNQADGGGVL